MGATCLTLVGCAGVPHDYAQTLYVVEGSLTSAIQVATVYAQLPACPTNAPVCSDAATVAKMQSAAQAASTAILSAQNATAANEAAAVLAAENAVTVLTNITSHVQVTR